MIPASLTLRLIWVVRQSRSSVLQILRFGARSAGALVLFGKGNLKTLPWMRYYWLCVGLRHRAGSKLMQRTPEPELMDEHEQAAAYAAADWRQSHEKSPG